ncbi:AraC family transcriptional regulator [Flavihumibacter profundi]|jgi:AraC-like DNA-binding protein|uniref:AraC family transcriptional regulator n=1 Tax=Flavihumibacter profundi TaxID=2716883 RepID=UPI001CC36319|nr:AraC family transcriptional regulator [Flavihumibacter profundi]MBZ5856002.1 AraC family transcriptional regulator [Flavihumibacter profundi]
MKPILRQVTATPENSFLVRKDKGSEMINTWHYHPELELLLIRKSAGTWLIGNHTGPFGPGDIVLIGPHLPHCFRHETQYANDNTEATGETICVKFLPGIFGRQFMDLPETRGIRECLAASEFGIRINDSIRERIGQLIEKMLDASNGMKLVYLLTILQEMADHGDFTLLSSAGLMQTNGVVDANRIKKVFDYTFSHYAERIQIDDVASLLNMTPQSFCRYFKQKTGKTYVQFLMEVRIGYACRLLTEDEKNVAEICYDCGYNNISHFNHQFKMITATTPLGYKKNSRRTIIQ